MDAPEPPLKRGLDHEEMAKNFIDIHNLEKITQTILHRKISHTIVAFWLGR